MQPEMDQEGTGGSSPEYQRALTALILIVAAFISMIHFPMDDALRHVGVAFGGGRSWGEVYPHSVFSKYVGYDPWWGFDLTLRGMAAVAGVLPISRLTAQFLALKALSFLFLAAFLLLAVQRSGVRKEVRSPVGLVAVASLIGLFLAAPIGRVGLVRPFVIGMLYLLAALPGGGALRGALAAGAFAFFYPYLFWMYTLPVAASHLLRGDRRYGTAAAAATAAAVALQPREFWGMLSDLARSDASRALIKGMIAEFSPITQESLLGVLVLLIVVCATPYLPAASRRIGVPHLLMLFFAPVAVKYVRYLIDVELTLLFVVCAGGLIPRWIPFIERIGGFWGGAVLNLIERLPANGSQDKPEGGRTSLRPWIVLCAAVLAFLVGYRGLELHREFRGLERTLAAIPRGSLVLTEFDLQYPLLYVRPDLRLVPSCEIGFPEEAISKQYLQYFNEGDPCTLAAAIGADLFVSAGRIALSPDRTGCLGRVGRAPVGDRFSSVVLWNTTASP